MELPQSSLQVDKEQKLIAREAFFSYGKIIYLSEINHNDEDIKKIFQAIDEFLKNIDSDQSLSTSKKKELMDIVHKALLEISYFIKDSEYKDEEETRLIGLRSTSHDKDIEIDHMENNEHALGKLYIETPPILFYEGDEVIIGPTVKSPESEKMTLDYRLRTEGKPDVRVTISRINYKPRE
jgi:hypothetical protein